jgi:Smg protein
MMFDVLMFLFENYMSDRVALTTDSETIVLELEKVGFDRYEIDRALEWIAGLNEFQSSVQAHLLSKQAIRHYLAEEVERLGTEGIGFLFRLEKLGILDPVTREMVIDRIMELDRRDIDLGRIRWVVLMALFNQPEKKSSLLLLQDMILADAFGVLH